jgi:hypothetical protein
MGKINTWGWVGIGAGTLALGTITYLILKSKNSDESGSGSGSGGSESGKGSFLDKLMGKKDEIKNIAENVTTGNAPAGTVYRISDYQEKTGGQTDLVINFASPRPKKGDIKSGNKILIAGLGKFDGNYSVYLNLLDPLDKGVWIDSSGNVGAIYVKTGKSTENKNVTVSSGTVTKV